MNKPFYVERASNGAAVWLKVAAWNYKEWTGCFCLIADKQEWSVKA